mgnify:CR=1 FL=1
MRAYEVFIKAAERHGIPFVNGESVAANLTERGFKWFFRVTPVALDFARAYSEFLKIQKAAGRKTDNIALVHENTEYGNSVGNVIIDQFKKDGFNVGTKIAYSANSSDVQPQVLQLKEKNPDVVIFISYTSDAILYTKTMKELNWKPGIMIADNAGFNDPAFVKSLSNQVDGLINRSAFSAGKPGSVPDLFNKLYVKKTGGEFFSGGDEATIIKAIQSIDRRAAGKIEMKQYSTERPRYQPFAMIAALLWCGALMLRFTIPTFQTFP